MKKRIIWQNVDVQVDEDFYDEYYPEFTEDERMNDALDTNDLNLGDERANLNIQLSGEIIAIADMGLWNGRKTGYKIIKSGNINDILYSDSDYVEWYSDGYNIKATMHHHDGTNYVEYREIRADRDAEKMMNMLYSGQKVSRSMINYYTKSILPEIAKVYGW